MVGCQRVENGSPRGTGNLTGNFSKWLFFKGEKGHRLLVAGVAIY